MRIILPILLLIPLLQSCTSSDFPAGTKKPVQPQIPHSDHPAANPSTRPASHPYIAFIKSGGIAGINDSILLTANPLQVSVQTWRPRETFLASSQDIRALAAQLRARGAFINLSPYHPGAINDAFEYRLIVNDGTREQTAVVYDPGAIPGEAEKMVSLQSLIKSFATAHGQKKE